MTLLFPSEAWFERYGEKIDDDEAYAEMASDWGTDFNGDFLFVMTDVPTEDLDEDELPEEIREDLDQYIVDGTGYAYLGLEGGDCTESQLVEHDDPAIEEAGFQMTGDYDAWTKLTSGQIGAIDGMMSGQFDLDGDMQKVMAASDAASRLTEISSEIDAVPVTEEYA